MDDPAQVELVSDDTVRVVLAGAVLLVRHADVLLQMQRTMKAGTCTQVHVELSEVTSLDSSGVALLILIRRLATGSGAGFRLLGVRPEILRHLQMVGLTALLGLDPADVGAEPAAGAAAETLDPAADATVILDEPFDRAGIRAIRERLSSYVAGCPISEFERYKVLLAATEIMANAVIHGGGRGVIRVERRGDRLMLRVTDHGPGIPRRHRVASPRPRPGRIGSSGLWLVRNVCERVDVDTGPGGTTVLLTYALPPRAE